MTDATQILMDCGIPAECLVNRGGPCPICGGKDRFRYDNRKGNGDYYCNGCGAGDMFTMLKKYHNINFEEALQMAREAGLPIQRSATNHAVLNQSHDDRAKANLDATLARCQASVGSVVEEYLRQRGLELPPPVSDDLQCLYAPDEPYFDPDTGKTTLMPCMVWKVRSHISRGFGSQHRINSRTNVMIHKTYLTQDGQKAQVESPKKYSPRWLPEHVSSQLGATYAPIYKGDSEYVIIAEGIENTIAAHIIMKERHGLDCIALALTNANSMSKFALRHLSDAEIGDTGFSTHFLPSYFWQKKYLVFGDNDSNFTGQLAAYTCASNIVKADSQSWCTVFTPTEVGVDWADALQGRLPMLDTINLF